MANKIGIFVETFPIVSETFIVNKVIYLLCQGYNVQIFTLRESSQWRFFPELLNKKYDIKNRIKIGVEVRSSDSLFLIGLKKLFLNLLDNPKNTFKFIFFNLFQSDNSFLSIIDRIFMRINFCNVEIDVLSIEFDTIGYKVVDLKKLLNCKILVNTMGVAQATNSYQRNPSILSYLNKYADFFRFASVFLQKNSIKLGFDKNIRNTVIYSGVNPIFNLNTLDRHKHTSKKLKIISVARLAWSKGYEFALEAVSLMIKSGIKVQYTIIGDGPYKHAIDYAIKQMGLIRGVDVILKGSKSLVHIKEELLKSDVFLQSSVIEGFGISVLEAQSVGLPAVVTDTGGLKENIVNYKTGLFTRNRDSKDIASKLICLSKDSKKLKIMGENGNARVKNNFTLKEEMRHLMKVYESLT